MSVSPLDRLLVGAQRLSGADPAAVTRLADALVAAQPGGVESDGGRSGLNYDGSPVQLAASASAEGVHYRLIADPALALADPLGRYRAAVAAMEQALVLTGSAALAPLLRQTLALVVGGEEHVDQYPDGVLWVAGGLDTPGAAVYVDARRGGPTVALERLRAWLEALVGPTEDVALLIDELRGQRLMCLGVEGLAPGRARAKVYWRLEQPRPLSFFGLPGYRQPAFARFVALCMGGRTIRPTGLVFSAGLHVPSGRITDVKLDLCACPACLRYRPDEAEEVVAAVVREFGLATVPMAEALRHGELANIGFGLDVGGAPRFNVYLKPDASATGAAPRPMSEVAP